MGEVQFDTTIFRPATFIERSLANLSHSMLLGCVLVVYVLLVFLFDWRSALISAMAIPLSLIAAILVLYWRGGTVNTMVLAGLVIALGEVVYATIIVVLAFLSVFFLEGLSGSFFRPLAASYILAILASLVVALTVTPAMSLLLLPATARLRHREGPVVRILKRWYRAFLQRLLNWKRVTLTGFSVVFAAIGCTIPWLGEELMPNFRETDFLMHWVEKPGIGIDAMDRITTRASQELMAVTGVRNFG